MIFSGKTFREKFKKVVVVIYKQDSERMGFLFCFRCFDQLSVSGFITVLVQRECNQEYGTARLVILDSDSALVHFYIFGNNV